MYRQGYEMTIEKSGNDKESSKYNSSRQHRDFGRHDIYMPKKINNIYTANTARVYAGAYNANNTENRFRFKNSLIMTPNYEEYDIMRTNPKKPIKSGF